MLCQMRCRVSLKVIWHAPPKPETSRASKFEGGFLFVLCFFPLHSPVRKKEEEKEEKEEMEEKEEKEEEQKGVRSNVKN